MATKKAYGGNGVELSWAELNEALKTVDEARAQKMLSYERDRKGTPRVGRLIRIHSRFNRLRAARERREMLGEE